MNTTKDKAIDALIEHEKAKQEIKKLKAKRRELLIECSNPEVEKHRHTKAAKDARSHEYIPQSCADIGLIDEDVYCEACRESCGIKAEALSEAKKELKASERLLSKLGKSLIKGKK